MGAEGGDGCTIMVRGGNNYTFVIVGCNYSDQPLANGVGINCEQVEDVSCDLRVDASASSASMQDDSESAHLMLRLSWNLQL